MSDGMRECGNCGFPVASDSSHSPLECLALTQEALGAAKAGPLTPADVLPDMMSLLSGLASDNGTLRDRFAMAFLTGFLSCPGTAPTNPHTIMSDAKAVAVGAYVYADAMLKARVQAVRPGPGGEGVRS